MTFLDKRGTLVAITRVNMLNEKAKKIAEKYVTKKVETSDDGCRSLQAEVNKINALIKSLSGNTNYTKKELLRVSAKVNELQTVVQELLASK